MITHTLCTRRKTYDTNGIHDAALTELPAGPVDGALCSGVPQQPSVSRKSAVVLEDGLVERSPGFRAEAGVKSYHTHVLLTLLDLCESEICREPPLAEEHPWLLPTIQ